jgi:hypothetical protein
MVVFASIFYAYLTFKNLQNNSKIFKYQRLPNLTIKAKGSLDYSFSIENNSQYPVKNVKVNFHIIYPIPKNNLFILAKWLLLHEYDAKIKMKPDHSTLKVINFIEPEDVKEINIEDKLLDILGIEQYRDRYGQYQYVNLPSETHRFDIIADLKYSSQDNLVIENPIYKKFEFEVGPKGINLIQDSDDPKTVY